MNILKIISEQLKGELSMHLLIFMAVYATKAQLALEKLFNAVQSPDSNQSAALSKSNQMTKYL